MRFIYIADLILREFLVDELNKVSYGNICGYISSIPGEKFSLKRSFKQAGSFKKASRQSKGGDIVCYGDACHSPARRSV